MAELPYMPVATDAILADAGDLPNDLFGAYTRLLFRWWRDGCEPEPNEKKLARWASCSADELDELKEFLTKTPDGWTQKRLRKVWEVQKEKSRKAALSAHHRWHKENPQPDCEWCANEKPSQCDGNANASENGCERIADAMLTMNHEPLGTNTDSIVLPSPSDIADATPVERPPDKPGDLPSGITSLLAEPIPSFESFWQAYPKRQNGTKLVKVGKAEAKAKWGTMAPKSKRAAMEGLPLYAQAAGDKPRDAVRYLRHRLWEDVEVSDAPSATGPPLRETEHPNARRVREAVEQVAAEQGLTRATSEPSQSPFDHQPPPEGGPARKWPGSEGPHERGAEVVYLRG